MKIVLHLTEYELDLLISSVIVHKDEAKDIHPLRQHLSQLQAKLYKQTKGIR